MRWPPIAQEFLDPTRGPDPTGDWSVEPGAFIALLLAGFLIAIVGHIYRVKTMIATGILLVFLATVGLPVVLHFTR